jgi:hypothetical protein
MNLVLAAVEKSLRSVAVDFPKNLKTEKREAGWPPFFNKVDCSLLYEQQELVEPQPEQPPPAELKSILASILKPTFLKSTLIGFTFSIKSLSTKKVKSPIV